MSIKCVKNIKKVPTQEVKKWSFLHKIFSHLKWKACHIASAGNAFKNGIGLNRNVECNYSKKKIISLFFIYVKCFIFKWNCDSHRQNKTETHLFCVWFQFGSGVRSNTYIMHWQIRNVWFLVVDLDIRCVLSLKCTNMCEIASLWFSSTLLSQCSVFGWTGRCETLYKY